MRYFLSIIFFPLLFSCSNESESNLQIAVAANAQAPMDSIIRVFNGINNCNCRIVSSSSGILYTQIEQGAPYDFFFSADTTYPKKLVSLGKAKDFKVYAEGQLLLVTGNKLEVLIDSTLMMARKIIIPDPKTAPYGKAAIEFLQTKGLYARLKEKIVFVESVGQVNQSLLAGAGDVGFTSAAYSRSFPEEYQKVLLPKENYKAIRQGYCAIGTPRGKKGELIMKFNEFLKTDKVKKIFLHYGYSVEEM